MTQDEVLAVFEECGALLKGHFVLSSGRHADTYLNKSIVSMYPQPTEKLCRALATLIKSRFGEQPTAVIAPAMGAIIFGYETARHLGLPSMFMERVDGEFQLRRGFGVTAGQKVIVVEDIVSTGLSSRETLDAVRKAGGVPLGLACLIDRSGGTVDLGVPMLPLVTMNVESWPADDLPPHLKNVPAVKPGSRGLK
ncbi:orotate phosphoribosyltransferase [Parvularcula sp. LCG005]|uniref:orotate phosphoribosyltransferase n=1 Tax=Parvularcula sp. LCG005 TaxID=3078805 RepID=UPI0029424E89|nr:orotate phosphoribosyltransferase [Parvularcula sp. LCG005]WOI54254.1 orotate phosphoribosyltransferase [Parvularcula sp. LCG005]